MKKILIIEDEPALLEILQDELKKQGFTVITATDGEEGLKKALSETPDLMLVDVIMPKMDGISMLNKLRAEPKGKDIPAIMLTNLSDPDTTAHALELGVTEFLVKTDWQLDKLIQKVKDTLKIK